MLGAFCLAVFFPCLGKPRVCSSGINELDLFMWFMTWMDLQVLVGSSLILPCFFTMDDIGRKLLLKGAWVCKANHGVFG